MRELYLCFIGFILWLIGGSSSFKAVIRFLAVCFISAFLLSFRRGWKGYFIIFIFVGGLLVFIIYLARLTKWRETACSFFWLRIGGGLIFWEGITNTRENRVVSFYFEGVIELWVRVGLFIFICLIVSQLLFSEKTLRALV